jgi:hypothetical protein
MISFERARLPWEDPLPELLENLLEDGLNTISETQYVNTTGEGTNLFNQNMLVSIVLCPWHREFLKKAPSLLRN